MTKSLLALAALLVGPSAAFVPSPHRAVASPTALHSVPPSEPTDGADREPSSSVPVSRRAFGLTAAAATLSLATLPTLAGAEGTSAPDVVVVAGATGQTGRRVLEILSARPNLSVSEFVFRVFGQLAELVFPSGIVRYLTFTRVPCGGGDQQSPG